MDSPDDDKRRVMTPPEEWTGNASSDDLDPLAGDTSWLDDSDLPPAPAIDDEPDSGSDTPEAPSTAAEAPADATSGDPDASWLEDSEPEAEAATDSIVGAASDDPPLGGGDTDWLGEDGADAEPPGLGEDPITMAANAKKAAEDVPPAAPTPPPAPETAEPSPEAILTDHHAAARPPSGARSGLLLAAAGAALLGLLATGGWLVYEDRTGLQERIAELEARPAARATSDQSGQLRQLEADKAALIEENAALEQQLDDAAAEIAGLRASLAETPPAPEPTVADATPKAPAQSPAEDTPSASEPAQAPRPETSDTGRWFVNVVSYNRRSTAERWLKRIQQDVDRAVLQESEMMDKPLLRIRAIGYSSMADAKAVAGFLEDKYDLAPLWVGTLSADELAEFNNPTRDEAAETATDTGATDEAPTGEDAEPGVADGGWFIYVDTYTDGIEADDRAQQINNAGYEAKVAVEYNGGDLFYRLQVVGITSREEGERITAELAGLGGMPNLQLRQY